MPLQWINGESSVKNQGGLGRLHGRDQAMWMEIFRLLKAVVAVVARPLLLFLGHFAQRRGRTGWSVFFFQGAYLLRTDTASGLELARAYSERANLNEALADLQRSLELDKRLVGSYLLRALVSLEAGQYGNAKADGEMIRQIAKADWPYHSVVEKLTAEIQSRQPYPPPPGLVLDHAA
jgi:tetratricopeptide (TPR) repeat protein